MNSSNDERVSLLRSHTSHNSAYNTHANDGNENGNGNGNGSGSGNGNGNGNGNAVKPSGHWSRWPARVVHLVRITLTHDYVNVLLIFVPLGIVAGFLKWDASAIFALNFVAIVPLASLLSFATEELAATMGQALGGLLNATFGNAVELIVRLSLSLYIFCANTDLP